MKIVNTYQPGWPAFGAPAAGTAVLYVCTQGTIGEEADKGDFAVYVGIGTGLDPDLYPTYSDYEKRRDAIANRIAGSGTKLNYTAARAFFDIPEDEYRV